MLHHKNRVKAVKMHDMTSKESLKCKSQLYKLESVLPGQPHKWNHLY